MKLYVMCRSKSILTLDARRSPHLATPIDPTMCNRFVDFSFLVPISSYLLLISNLNPYFMDLH